MVKPTEDTETQGKLPGVRWSLHLNLTVWSAQDGWHARLVGADTPQRDFASPFELARFLAQTAPVAAPGPTPSSTRGGLR